MALQRLIDIRYVWYVLDIVLSYDDGGGWLV